MDAREKSDALMNWRIAYLGNSMVNWCPALGTVLANDEVSEGLSLRGGYPVEQKMMYQWCLRVSAYAGRLLADLEKLDWTDSLKETQRNWIGRSEGAEMHFAVDGSDVVLDIFTTRADTVFGVTFMVLAPESAYVDMVTTADRREAVRAYVEATKRKTERERMIDKKVSGEFTGAYAVNPLSGARVPIYVSDYVLAGYGTGAIMAVPAHDSRDYAFARHFDLRERLAPVALAAEYGVAQAVVHLHAAYAFLLYEALGGGYGVLHLEAVEVEFRTRGVYHAAAFGIEVGVLPALHGSAQRRRSRGPRGQRLLAQRRPLHRRYGACHRPPYLQPLLEQIPV